jgi:hypothetical protein
VPESTAATRSIPVPTSGFSGRSTGNSLTRHVGTHQRGLRRHAPGKELQRNRGPTPICAGDTSMYWTRLRSPRLTCLSRADTRSPVRRPLLSSAHWPG